MNSEQLLEIIKGGEKSNVEFKKCSTELTSFVFESICAFLNREGGHLLIGVSDNNEVTGINENYLSKFINNINNTLNNPEQFNPTIFLTPREFELAGKKVLYIDVPESSQVHRYKNRVFDRVGEADNDITYNFQLIDNLHLKKRNESSENTVYPYLSIDDLDVNTFRKMRQHIAIFNPAHSWLEMTDDEMLKSAGFWRKDPLTNREGFVLAAVLLFGKEQTILSCCPFYRTDAIYRNMQYHRYLKPLSTDPDIRYDDRDLICENLILAYSRLLNFVQRNLPDKFRLDEMNLNRIDLRNIIFREIVANLLIHREFSNSYPAKFLIFADRVITENWSKPLQSGKVTLANWEAHTKNPLITKVFREMKWVEELGSGRKNILKYAPFYFEDYKISIDNKEKFVFSITYKSFTPQDTPHDTLQDGALVSTPPDTPPDAPPDTPPDGIGRIDLKESPQVSTQVKQLLEVLSGEMTRVDLQGALTIANKKYFLNYYIKPALEAGLIEMVIPDKPTSKYQKYRKVKKY